MRSIDKSQQFGIDQYSPSEIVSVEFYCRWCGRFALEIRRETQATPWACGSCGGCVEPEVSIKRECVREVKEAPRSFTYIPNVAVEADGSYAGDVPAELRPSDDERIR